MTLDDLARQAQFAAEGLLESRRRPPCANGSATHGKLSAAKIEAEQHAAHGLAWLATYVEAIKELAAYARRMHEEGRFGETEELLTRIGLGEYLAQIFGGIPMNQGEIVRLADFGLERADIAPFRDERAVEALIEPATRVENRAALADADRATRREARSATPASTRPSRRCAREMRRFADAEVVPHAQDWHRANAYIPLEVIAGLSEWACSA